MTSSRKLVFILALIGCAIATYLTAVQLGLTSAWDPIFGPASTERVITSPLSRMLPIPDAVLGALAYLVEAILTLVGGRNRCSTHPWVVTAFGALVAALALAGIGLLLTQLVVVHAFCTLCLTSASISFVNAALAWDEVHASLGVLTKDARRSIAL